ncbi:hypothetical protein [Shimia sp.]|uniref:hypothetical protein n=1 Tax=Shimia sp. TaxID=1954381 RepID=UPI0032993243
MRFFGLVAAICISPAGIATAGETRIAEDQTPTGKFMTATEIRPILTATKGNWVAVREYGGQDLVYFTHLLSWRCGLHSVQYSINGGDIQEFPIPECPADIAQPNAIPDDALIYLSLDKGVVQSVEIELLYDDLGVDSAMFERAAILIP